MRRLLILSFASLLAAGCACDPAAEACELAGSGAIDCGYARLGEDRTAVTDCLDAAIESGDRAFGGWQELGLDSELRVFFTLRTDRTYRLLYDGDVSGGGDRGAQITVFPCDGPPVRSASGYWCTGSAQEPYTICD